MSQLVPLANEVDFLVREIIEAVPTFSYALGKGNYGPLPFSVNNVSSAASIKDNAPRAYLEAVQIIPRVNGGEVEGDAMPLDNWWPLRLKADLNEGILREAVTASPDHGLHTFGGIGQPSPSVYDSSLARTTAGEGLPRSSGTMGTERSDILLEEGRKRWLEYQEKSR